MSKFIIAALFLFLLSPAIQAQPSTFPSFNLPDPQGGMHSSAQLLAHGVVAIVSAPTLHDKSAQQGWASALVATKGSNPGSLILIEDMQASAFKGMAQSEMKKDWHPGVLPILLEDNTGKVHGAFGIGKDETKVFVFDKSGKMVYSTAMPPSEAAAKTVWSKLSSS